MGKSPPTSLSGWSQIQRLVKKKWTTLFLLLSNLKRKTHKTYSFLIALKTKKKLPKVATAWRSIALALDLREVVPNLEVTI